MRTLVSLALAAFAVVACSSQASLPAGTAPGVRAARGASRSDAAKTLRRLFVSDAGTGDVYIFDVPSLTLLAIVTGFTSPQGECADDKGDVWVADSQARTIDEMNFAGRIVKHLSDSDGYPDGCAWDPKNGNLAVMNLFDTGTKSGSVLVYHRGAGLPNAYTNPQQFYYDFGGYDDDGDLFFDGSDAAGKFVLSMLPANAESAHSLRVSGGKLYSAGMVQWTGSSNALDVGDQQCGNTSTTCLYELSLAGKRATIAGQISLDTYAGGKICDLVQGTIVDGQLYGSDDDYCGYADSATYVWPYPSGGAPTNYEKKNDSKPIGAALATESGSETRAR